MTRFRPSLSAITEENGETRSANRDVDEVMTDLSSEVKGLLESDVPIETSVAETTPVSSGKGQWLPCLKGVSGGD